MNKVFIIFITFVIIISKEFEEHELAQMQKNAWYCAEEIQKRIHRAPVFNEYIKSYITPKDSIFFFNKRYLKQYQSATSATGKQNVPGYHYIPKIMTFLERHYRIGELHMEYIKEGCEEKGEICDRCQEIRWVGPRFSSTLPGPRKSRPLYERVRDADYYK